MVQILFIDLTVYRLPPHFKWRGSLYTIRSVIFNLEHDMDSLHFISNGEDLNPNGRVKILLGGARLKNVVENKID